VHGGALTIAAVEPFVAESLIVAILLAYKIYLKH
jgi:hypothetical protein